MRGRGCEEPALSLRLPQLLVDGTPGACTPSCPLRRYCKQRTCQKQSQAWGGVCPSQQSNICDRLPATPAL